MEFYIGHPSKSYSSSDVFHVLHPYDSSTGLKPAPAPEPASSGD
jgi:hypothetical protein